MDAAALSALTSIKALERYSAPLNIMVVGCGGTGGYLVSHLARLIQVMNDGNRWQKLSLTLADGDVVEEKNLVRQHFIRPDLGKNKAEALADRYSAAFGLEITTISKDLESVADFNVLDQDRNSCVVVGCVDNNASRRVINEWFLHDPPGHGYGSGKFWIDSGNEETAGQVICGYRPPLQRPWRGSSFSLPSVVDHYPDILDGDLKFNSELSCAERAASAPQNMMTNVTAATLVMNILQKLLLGQPLNAHGAVFTIDNSIRSILNTPENLNKVAEDRRRKWENT
jgi:PRTRC genetic system ThiF family protein